MALDLKSHLSQLCDTPGPSGFEGPVREVITQAWADLTDEQRRDALGNLIATKRSATTNGGSHKIMLTAHMDEIGLMATKLDGPFVRVTSIGGIDRRVLPGQLVTVHGQRDLPGVIGSRPPHIVPVSERNKYLPLKDLVVDLGLSARQVADLVSVGDIVSFAPAANTLQGKLLSAKALDNRASVAALTVCLEALQTRAHTWDVAAVATVQEEVTMGGGIAGTYHVQPDLAIVVDVTFAVGDGVSEGKGFPLGEGPVIGLGANVHTRLFERLRETAKKMEMDHKIEPIPRDSGTDARVVQVSREGVPTALLSIPIRNMHTPVEIVSLEDIERAGRLLAEFVAALDGDTLIELRLDQVS